MNMKILVADDSKTNIAIISAALEKMGHVVFAASSGEQAIELFQQQSPDLIILDVIMGGIDGFECASRIRKLDNNDWIPIIFLSASVDDISIAKGIDAGGDDYLTKPFSEITLAAKIKAMQRISDMRQKLFDTTRQLYLLSSTDSLTGVYSRLQFDRSFKEIIGTADCYHHALALFFIDLDNFKNINDSFGHHIGDLLLVEVAKRLKSCTRSNDFIARLGGDEFAMILNEIENAEEARYVAQKIINTLDVDYNLESHNIRSACSIGIALYPAHATTQENLILNADIAMYHAKASGRNNYQLFTTELNDKYKQRMNLEHALKFALERKELSLTYQPIFELHTKKLVGLETLLFWDHPQFGIVSPSIFIPLAEEAGLISQIGNWMIRTACQQAAQWSLHKLKDFKFTINISSRQVRHEDFYQQIVDIIADTRINSHLLELELTETVVMNYTNVPILETINKLHNLGIGISIDDFGTGYSSLIRLKNLPINTLKIEKSFIQDAVTSPHVGIIVSYLIALGKNLGMNVIAEGIETKEQLEFLQTKACPQGQGYYLSKPLTTEQMTNFLDDRVNELIRSASQA